jgi:hypothetical protein
MSVERYELFDILKHEGCKFITPDVHSQATAFTQKRSKFKIDERSTGIVTDCTSNRSIPSNFWTKLLVTDTNEV